MTTLLFLITRLWSVIVIDTVILITRLQSINTVILIMINANYRYTQWHVILITMLPGTLNSWAYSLPGSAINTLLFNTPVGTVAVLFTC